MAEYKRDVTPTGARPIRAPFSATMCCRHFGSLLRVRRERLAGLASFFIAFSPNRRRSPSRRRIGELCGNGPLVWYRMQEAYDLWHAENALRKEIEKIPTIKAA